MTLPPAEVRVEELLRLSGSGAGAGFGARVACAGDMNGDGEEDLVVGAPQDDTAGEGAGAVYVFYGPFDRDRDSADADAILLGEGAQDNAGAALAGVGDVSGDGIDDLVVGAWRADRDARFEDTGTAYVLFGPVAGTASLAEADVQWGGEAPGDAAGFALAAAGDLDRDGQRDLAIGAFHAGEAGVTYVLRGPLESGAFLLADADMRFVGEHAGDHSGLALAGAVDVTGDGFDDLAIGAPFHDGDAVDSGGVYVVSAFAVGSTGLGEGSLKFTGVEASSQAGTSLALIGGTQSGVLVGAPFAAPNGDASGAAYFVAGPVTESRRLDVADVVLSGEHAGDGFGIDVAGEVIEGAPDQLLVGAWGVDDPEEDSGVVYSFDGSTPNAIVRSPHRGDGLGASVVFCGEGSNRVIAVGASGFDNGESSTGSVFLLRPEE